MHSYVTIMICRNTHPPLGDLLYVFQRAHIRGCDGFPVAPASGTGKVEVAGLDDLGAKP